MKPESYQWNKAMRIHHVAIIYSNDEITGKKFTFFRDPDGLPLEFYEK